MILISLFQCTYGPPCKSDEKVNFVSVLNFKNTKGQKGTDLKCYFIPNEPTHVILDNSAHEMMTFHAMFWPCCVLLIGVCMLLKAYYLKRTIVKQSFLLKDNTTTTSNNNNNVYNYQKNKVFDEWFNFFAILKEYL